MSSYEESEKNKLLTMIEDAALRYGVNYESFLVSHDRVKIAAAYWKILNNRQKYGDFEPLTECCANPKKVIDDFIAVMMIPSTRINVKREMMYSFMNQMIDMTTEFLESTTCVFGVTLEDAIRAAFDAQRGGSCER